MRFLAQSSFAEVVQPVSFGDCPLLSRGLSPGQVLQQTGEMQVSAIRLAVSGCHPGGDETGSNSS